MTRTHRICVLAGDGIGPEVTAVAVRVLAGAAAAHGFALETDAQLFGGAAIDATGNPFPDAVREACLGSDAVLLGAVGGPGWERGGPRPEEGIMALRKTLDVYANLRPIRRWYAGATSPLRSELIAGVDMLIVRELTGGLYFGERGRTQDGAYDTLAYSEHEIRRILRTGFRLARERRGHLTSVDKANVLESSRLWRELAEEIALEFPDVHLEHQLVDSMTMKLVELPASFDVVVTENLFGDILSDLAASLAGGIGLAPSASLADRGPGVFEPIHGTAPDIAGSGRANPAAACLSAAMLLRELGEHAAAADVESAVIAVLDGGPVTPDLGGDAGTEEVADAIVGRLADTVSGGRA
jgi:3-isopropylmalate dehydrogenase